MTDKEMNLRHYDVIVSPVLTEKSNMLAGNYQYVFDVAKSASKPEIKAAVEAIFNVEVKSVNTLVRKGKQRVFRGRRGMRKDFKRAIVSVKDNKRIDIASEV